MKYFCERRVKCMEQACFELVHGAEFSFLPKIFLQATGVHICSFLAYKITKEMVGAWLNNT